MPAPEPVIVYPPELPVSAARDEIARAQNGAAGPAGGAWGDDADAARQTVDHDTEE